MNELNIRFKLMKTLIICHLSDEFILSVFSLMSDYDEISTKNQLSVMRSRNE